MRIQLTIYYVFLCFKFHQTIQTYLNNKVWDFHFYVAKNWPEDPICVHFPGCTSTVRYSINQNYFDFIIYIVTMTNYNFIEICSIQEEYEIQNNAHLFRFVSNECYHKRFGPISAFLTLFSCCINSPRDYRFETFEMTISAINLKYIFVIC